MARHIEEVVENGTASNRVDGQVVMTEALYRAIRTAYTLGYAAGFCDRTSTNTNEYKGFIEMLNDYFGMEEEE